VRAGETAWGPGDLLLLFSDGVSDTRDAHDRPLGETRVLDLVREQRALPARELVERVLALAAAVSAVAPDDRTILVLKG
jgi:serine phosphatase RsbU (regulator of sigma subunit)